MGIESAELARMKFELILLAHVETLWLVEAADLTTFRSIVNFVCVFESDYELFYLSSIEILTLYILLLDKLTKLTSTSI